ncbi:EamA family transporter RarD [Spartinivicinus poritis]|uniref:EamA family transporter RarD n=1 Tax=Spartinivicinus poritis TaxID=2994640 RepID=A0ABT5UGD7_9GAMM|nr:EamA family transporter RarD [Spartinivicinus sp. A2-2]MDE1465441.1 EamA family transporter RarD [Spartinivicinus sp. A2-2]
MTATDNQRMGIISALIAFFIWGTAPLYFKWVADVPPPEVLVHRVIWSVILLLPLLCFTRQLRSAFSLLKNRRQFSGLLLSSTLAALNWLTFIWAIANNKVLETSLGYFINPLTTLLLGYLFLAERLSKRQYFAVCLAIAGVAVELLSLGKLPLVALILACSFSVYTLIRKKIQVPAIPGLFIETLLMLPIAAGYFIYLLNTDTNYFNWQQLEHYKLIFAGLITTIPLLFFAAAATRLPLSTIGFIQYISPTMTFLMAIWLFNEPFSLPRLICFFLIWTGLIIYSFDMKWQQTPAKCTE